MALLPPIETLVLNSLTWETDTDAIVLYCPDAAPPAWTARLQRQCYVVTPDQYAMYCATPRTEERVYAMYALRGRGWQVHVFFHPGQVSVYIDEVVGYQTVRIAPHERLGALRAVGVSLVPVQKAIERVD